MNRHRMKVLIGTAAVAAIAGGSVATVAALSSDEASQTEQKQAAEARALLDSVKPYMKQSHPIVRSKGADPADARPIGKTSSGQTISAVATDEGRCVLVSDNRSFCASDEQIAKGQSVIVNNDCAKPGGDMEVIALTAPGAVKATLVRGDKTAAPMELADGVAWIATTTPTGSDAPPTAVQPYGAGGEPLTAVAMPGWFCPPTDAQQR